MQTKQTMKSSKHKKIEYIRIEKKKRKAWYKKEK